MKIIDEMSAITVAGCNSSLGGATYIDIDMSNWKATRIDNKTR